MKLKNKIFEKLTLRTKLEMPSFTIPKIIMMGPKFYNRVTWR